MNEGKLENLPDPASFKAFSFPLSRRFLCSLALFHTLSERFLCGHLSSSRSIRSCFLGIRICSLIRSCSFVRICSFIRNCCLVRNCTFISICCLVRICTLSCSIRLHFQLVGCLIHFEYQVLVYPWLERWISDTL